MKKTIKHIAILCSLDMFANTVRPLELKKQLIKKGYKVSLISNTELIENISSKLIFVKQTRHERAIYSYFDKMINGKLYFIYLLLVLNFRARKLKKLIKEQSFDLLIIENHLQAFVAKYALNVPYILDLDVPYFDELYYTNKIDKWSYRKLISIYKDIYRKAKNVNFQWHTYSDYVKKTYYNGSNFIEFNFGCHQKSKLLKAKFNKNPKIICMGYLGGKWVNLPLLSRLSKLYPIDVYGGPEPDNKWGLNYRGYAPTTDILSQYQFGLITISDDKLRRSSFSSKHLEYISYGLPVLTPEWRFDKILQKTSIYYNEKNFVKKIKDYSSEKKWQEISAMSFKTARKLNWISTLRPLLIAMN